MDTAKSRGQIAFFVARRNMKTQEVQWYHSLVFKGISSMALIAFWLMMGVILIINTMAKDMVLEESAKLIEQTGNNAVSELNQLCGLVTKNINQKSRHPWE